MAKGLSGCDGPAPDGLGLPNCPEPRSHPDAPDPDRFRPRSSWNCPEPSCPEPSCPEPNCPEPNCPEPCWLLLLCPLPRPSVWSSCLFSGTDVYAVCITTFKMLHTIVLQTFRDMSISAATYICTHCCNLHLYTLRRCKAQRCTNERWGS